MPPPSPLSALHLTEEQFRVTLASIADAVISTDVAGRVTFMNAVAEKLTGWIFGEALGQPLERVFHIADESTRRDVENPVQRVLREGHVIGLGNHTVLIARDGRSCPIDDSAAPVRDAGGTIRGVVLIFRDAGERRRAERQALRLASIVEHSVDGIVAKDLLGIVTDWNRSAERIFGYTSEEMVGQSIRRLIPADRQDEEDRILEKLRRGEIVESFESVRLHKDGRRLHVRLSISPIKDRHNRIIGASKIARDLTPLRELEERYRATLASIGDGVISTDDRGNVTFLNRVAEELTGWKREEAAGQPLSSIFKIVHEFTHETIENPVDRVLREGRIVGLGNHTILIARDGTHHQIDDSAAPIQEFAGLTVGVVLVFRDVSGRRQVEIDLLRLGAIVENSGDAIMGKSLNGVVTSWNKGAERIFGFAADEMIGQSVRRIIPADRQHEEDEIQRKLSHGEVTEMFETIRQDKDGRQIPVQVGVSAITDGEGHVVGVSSIVRDITRQREAQQRIEAMQADLAAHAQVLEARVHERTAELEEKVAELEAFSYSLSHDMRAPLRAISSFTQLVLTDHGSGLDPEAVGHLQRVIKASLRMDRLIQDVLAFSRLSRQVLPTESVDVEQLVDELIHERPELQLPRAEIEIVRPLLPMQAHAALLTQAVGNLLDNAVKFVARGVTPHVRVRTEALGESVRLWIEDNGIGISREAQRRLFTLFQRINPTGHYEGMGIGLAIVRKAAERLNGLAGVESEPDRGSRFWLQLPKA